MPRFSIDDIFIDPDEFLEACSNKELSETFEQLQENYGFASDEEKEVDETRSEGHRIFLKNLRVLRENWLGITKEDAQIIDVLGKKYGAV